MTYQFIPDLSDDNEYAIVCWGQSNARPLGDEDDMEAVSNELTRSNTGTSFTVDNPVALSLGSGRYLMTVTVGSLTANEWAGAKIRFGTNTTPVAGYGTVLANDAATLTVDYTGGVTPASGSNVQAYVMREDFRWATYPQVRVLTPYVPMLANSDLLTRSIGYPTPNGATYAGGAERLVIPGYTLPAGVTTFREMAVFLPWTNEEGINGYGESDVWPAPNAGSTALGNDWTVASSLAAPTNYFVGGYLVVEWHDGSGVKRSWGKVSANSGATITVESWEGDLVPTANYSSARWQVWVPYPDDNPHAYKPGLEFAYPNNDHQPPTAVTTGPTIRNRPRGITTTNYPQQRVGPWLSFAMRMSATLGKRINVILLGVSGSSLYPSGIFQPDGFQGSWGWWKHTSTHDWDPLRTDGNFARLKELIYPMAGNALLAEGISKPLKILAFAGMQGEGDATKVSGRETYDKVLDRFMTVLRDWAEANNLSPYSNGVHIPIVHPQIAVDPNEILYDTEGLVNDGIRRVASVDQFFVTLEPDAAERNPNNNIHYSGAGYARIGAWMHEALAPKIEYSLSFGAPALTQQPTQDVELCNRALGLLGESSRIVSLTDGSYEATLCAEYLPDARDELLQLRRWSFATKRAALTTTLRPDPDTYPQWAQVYLVPREALQVFSVVPDDTNIRFDSADTSGVGALVAYQETSQAFVVEEIGGVRFLFTNVENAIGRYTLREPDRGKWSPTFRNALALMLAAKLAGPIIKGDQGEATSERLMKKALALVNAAQTADAVQRNIRPDFIPNHLSDR